MKTNFFDKVIVSSDDSSLFLNFWPIVCKSWKKYFEITPTLAFVSNRSENDNLVKKLKLHGDVVIVPELYGIPQANQAKIARFLVACKFENQICTVEDIDTIPLQAAYVDNRLSLREKDKILAIGKEIHPEFPKFPISHITSEGRNFKKLFNPQSLSHEDLLKSFVGLSIFDRKENIVNDPAAFSDESLIRALVQINNMNDYMQHVRRDVDIRNDWIDRSWWNINQRKLETDNYVCCNFKRPLIDNLNCSEPVIQHIFGCLPNESELFVL